MNYQKLIRLNPNMQEMIVCDKPVRLRVKEYELLEYIITNPNKIISKSELLENVWGKSLFSQTNTIESHMSKLRKKIGMPKDVIPIKTLPCRGYVYEPGHEFVDKRQRRFKF